VNIIFRYLLTTGFKYQIAMFSGFSLLLIGQQVIGILGKLPNIQLSQLALIVIYIIPDAINDIAPIALVLAVLLTGNQLYSQSEIHILKNAGFGPLRTSLPLIILSLITGFVMTINGSYLKPVSELKLSELVFDVTNANFTSYLIPGEFRTINSLGMTLNAESKQDNVLMGVFIHHQPSNQIITGQRAYIQNIGPYNYSLIVEDGSVLSTGDSDSSLTDFDSYSAQLVREAFKPRNSVEFMDSFELYKHKGHFATSEFHWRLSRFWYCVFLIAIALLFVPKTPRAGTSLAIFSGLVMYFIYNKIANTSYSAAAKGELNATWLFWWLYPTLYAIAVTVTFTIRRIRDAF
jgi:LPS export ABC transporter permease LptF